MKYPLVIAQRHASDGDGSHGLEYLSTKDDPRNNNTQVASD